MAEPTGAPSSDAGTSRARRLVFIVGATLAVALIGTGLVRAVIGGVPEGDDGTVLAQDDPSTSPSPGEGPSPSERPEPTPSPTPTPTDPDASTGSGGSSGSGGSGDPWVPPTRIDPVEIDEPAEFQGALEARVTSLESIQGEAAGPGEIAGPALRVTIRIENSTSEAVDLSTAIVVLYTGTEETPAVELSGPGRDPLSGRLAPGAATTGVYVFAVGAGERDQVLITVSYSPDEPAVAFEGSAPAA